MTCRCSHCGQPMPVTARDPVADMRAWLRERGFWVGPSDTIDEAAAAAALGRSTHTLRGWRATDGRLRYRKSGGRLRYQLADVAAFAGGEND